ncbi:unnamed protein product, partial [Schistosoma mattheei]
KKLSLCTKICCEVIRICNPVLFVIFEKVFYFPVCEITIDFVFLPHLHASKRITDEQLKYKFVTSADGTVEIGRITRKWSNIVQEFFTDADNFGVSFPMDLDVKVKAILLAAVFLIVSYTIAKHDCDLLRM